MSEKIMEKITLNWNWSRPNLSYILVDIIEQESFDSEPTTTETLYFVKIHKGYGFDEGYGVIRNSRQEGHSQYSDCSEDLLNQFETKDKAEEFYREELDRLYNLYPN